MNSSTPLPHETSGENKPHGALEIIRHFLQKFGLLAEAVVKQETIDPNATAVIPFQHTINDAYEHSASCSESYTDSSPSSISHTGGEEEEKPEEKKPPLPDKGSYGTISHQLIEGKGLVTIKKLSLTADAKFTRADCEREKNIMVALNQKNSPYIVRYIAYKYSPPDYCIAMEHVAGGSLCSYINSHPDAPFSWDTRYRIMQQLTEGLAVMHSINILHRDIKAENILLANIEDETKIVAKFCDFGTAKYLDDPYEYPTTVAYVAPELMSIQEVLSTAQSDIYTLGTLFWVLAAWDPKPYHGEAIGSVLQKTLHGERLRIPAGTEIKISHLIQWCWQTQNLRPNDDELLTEIRTGMKEESQAFRDRMTSFKKFQEFEETNLETPSCGPSP